MAPKSPLKKVDNKKGKVLQGNVRSRSQIPKRTKTSLTQGVTQDASTLPQKKAAVASTSKLPTTRPATAPAVASYQSTPKRAPVPLKPSRVASVSPELFKKKTSQAPRHKLKGSPRAKKKTSRHKENQPPYASLTLSHEKEQSPLPSRSPSKVLQSKRKQHLSKRSTSPKTATDRPPTITPAEVTPAFSARARLNSSLLAAKALNVLSSGGRRRRSIQKITQLSTFVRPTDEAKPPLIGATRSSSSAAAAVDPAADRLSAEVSDDGTPAKKSSALVPDDTVISLKQSPGSPGSKTAKLLSVGEADSGKYASSTSKKKSQRKSTPHQGTILHARRPSGSSFHTPVASVINGTPGRQGRSALNTPFRSQTPKCARWRSPVPLFSDPEVKHTPKQLDLWDRQMKEWLYRPWKLCFMSALTDFEVQTQNMLTAYQNTLRQLISETVPFTLQVTIEPRHCFSRDARKVDSVALSISYSVPVEWDVRQQRQTAVAAMATGDAALAAASSRQKKKKKKKKAEGAAKVKGSKMTAETSKRKNLYTALLVRADLTGGEAEQAGVAWYPLYFYAGRESVHHSVVGWLQDSFGSLVCLRSLRAPALLWAAGLWMQQPCGEAREDDNHKEQVVLEYQLTGLSTNGWQKGHRIPSRQHVKDVSKLTLEVPVVEMRRIAKCIVPEESAEVTEGERDLLHNVLQNMVHFLTKLPHTALRLKAISTACVSIKATGEIKVMCRRHLKAVLDFLLDLHREDSLLDQVDGGSFEDQDSSRDSLDSKK